MGIVSRLTATVFAGISIAISISVVGSFAQGTGSEGYFDLHNNTQENVLVGFYTNDGTGWSDNWIDEDVQPGERIAVEFIADTGECAQTLRAGWLGSDEETEVLDEPFNIDICDASNVYLGDNDVRYD